MVRTNWALRLVGLFSLTWIAGCYHPCYMSESDYKQCANGQLPHDAALEANNDQRSTRAVGAVSTVAHPEGERRLISLQECIAIALENGRANGASIRVLAYDPAIAQTAIEQSLSTFDARLRTSMIWNTIDERAGSASQNVLLLPGEDTVKMDQAEFVSQIIKPLPTGGTAGITFRTNYEFSDLNAAVNPLYRPRLVFNLEQPLLQGAGVEINQVRSGILISRLNLDQAHTTFAGNINDLLFSVEEAYWNLYFAYYNLYTQDLAMQQSYEAWRAAKVLFDRGEFKIQDLALLEQQYQTFRLARLDALGGSGRSILEAERQLRLLVGLPPEDCTRLVPSDTPTTAPVCPDWPQSLVEALDNRPELIVARQEIAKARLEVKRARDLLKPDLRAIGSYDINGLGNRLDGASDTDNALRSLATNNFHNWTVGLQLDVPIGARNALALTRRARLQLEQRLEQLQDRELQATFTLQRSYRQLVTAHERVRVLSALRKAATTQYRALYEEFRRGLGTLQFMLQAQQNWVAAMRDERSSIFDYNIALADFERQKGTIMRFDNVSVAEGPLPAYVQSQASDHIRARQNALTIRQRPDPAGAADLDASLSDGPLPAPVLLEKISQLPETGDLPGIADKAAAPAATTPAATTPVSLPNAAVPANFAAPPLTPSTGSQPTAPAQP